MKKITTTALLALAITLLTPVAYADNAVARVADGTWGDPLVIYGNGFAYSNKNIWVDIKVKNLGYQKAVGIRWTDNNWYTSHDANASYELPLANGYEQWGVDVKPVGKLDMRRYGAYWIELSGFEQAIGNNGKSIQYAIFYKDHNNIWHWDNNKGQNYSVQVVAPN